MKITYTLLAFLVISFTVNGQNQFQNETAGALAFASGKVMQLAEAFPEDKYDWSPAVGVRSVKGVLAHVISANYFFGSKLGAMMPEGIDPQNIESTLTSKEVALAQLKSSYDFINTAILNSSSDQLNAEIEVPFPGDYTGMSMALIGLSHTNEHLGQLITYARSNDITPPWSQE